MKKQLIFIFTLITLMFISCNNATNTKIELNNINIKNDTSFIKVGDTFTISVENEDKSICNNITFIYDTNYVKEIYSTKSSITLLAINKGTTLLTAVDKSTNKKASISIEITDKANITLETNKKDNAVMQNDDITITLKSNDNTPLSSLTWLYDESSFQKVSQTSNSITVKAVGFAPSNITVKDSNGSSLTINISILNPYFEPSLSQPIGYDNYPLYSKDYLHRIVRSYFYNGGAYRDNPKPNVDFSSLDNKIILSTSNNEGVSLSLLDTFTNENIKDVDVQWFIVETSPVDLICTLEESNTSPDSPVSLEMGREKSEVIL